MILTPKQMSVIEYLPGGRILVEAGPGTGKTEVVARRLAWLLSSGGLRPSQILVLSFSRAAVKALVNRVGALEEIPISTIEEMRHLAIRTFDSWAFRILRFWGDSPDELLSGSHDKNIGILTDRLSLAHDVSALPAETRLKDIRHIIVDEFQDLTGLRALLVKELLEKLAAPGEKQKTRCGFSLLGDSNQAIYGWTQKKQGSVFSSGDLIAWVKSKYASDLKLERLTENHRSAAGIASVVSEAAEKISEAETRGQDPYEAVCSLLADEDRLQLSDIVLQVRDGGAETGLAVLCRSNSQVVDIGVRFSKQMKDGGLQKLDFILDICAGDSRRQLPPWIAGMLHRFKVNQLTKGSFRRIYDELAKSGRIPLPCSGSWEEGWKLLLRCAQKPETETSIQMTDLRERLKWPDSLPDDEDCGCPRIVVTTIHKSKGLEYDLVRLVEPNGDDRGEADPSEEARVLFVGMSRARRDLSLLAGEMQLEFHHKQFPDSRRSRWHHWHDVKFKGAYRYMEIGLEGDISRQSFVSPEILGGDEGVKTVQGLLLGECNDLTGEEIVLKKTQTVPGRYTYNIVLPKRGDMIIGQMSDSLKFDLIGIKHSKQSLPTNIYGLRINRVTTVVSPNPVPEGIPEPWKSSGLWAGVDIHGMGEFITFWLKK